MQNGRIGCADLWRGWLTNDRGKFEELCSSSVTPGRKRFERKLAQNWYTVCKLDDLLADSGEQCDGQH